jgi:hypothetical protein
MVWWEWLGSSWLVIGVSLIICIELVTRADESTGPLSQDRLLSSVAYSAALLAGAPVLVLYSLSICAQILWQGRIPISNRVWWSARARNTAASDSLPSSRETTLCEMIRLRQRKDPRLRCRRAPSNWPMFELWETTEAIILDTVEKHLWLCEDGLDDQVALEKIEVFRTGSATSHIKPNSTPQSYLAHRLSVEDPGYLVLGEKVLLEAIRIAEEWAHTEICRTTSDRPYPPKHWLKARVSLSEVEGGKSLPFGYGGLAMINPAAWTEGLGLDAREDRNWQRVKLRMLPSDELWTFSSPPEYWRGLAGRMGIVLIRNDRPIEHVTTVMN